MNGSLRAASGKFPASMTEHLKGNTYTNLIYACNSLLRKFSQISNIPKGRVVYRGLSGVNLPQCFEECEEGGGRGGVDFGFLSTTRRREVAASYIGDKGKPVLFMFEVGDIDRGASLSFLSQYPNEEEILIPPLSYLEVIGEPFFMETDKGDVKVYRARINCNLKSQTLEEIVAHRQKEVLALLPYLDGALRRDLPHVAAAVLADLEKARITKGMHVLAAGDRAKKGVVETDDRSSNPYKVRWSHGELSGWLVPADIVLDEAAEENEALLQEKKTKVVQVKPQILSDFETLCAEMKTPEKITWCTTTQLFDGAHGASSVCRAAADAGCPRAG